MKKNNLKEVASLFLKLGLISFGGPVAHTAMMHNEVVVKRKWMNEQHFLDLVGATNLIPGPNSTEMAIHIGHERSGWKGLILAGVSFILPAVIITIFFSWIYKLYGQLPQVQPFIYGIKPAIIAIILAAIFPLAKKSVKTWWLGLLGLGSLVLCLVNFNEIYVMFGAGLLWLMIAAIRTKKLKSGSYSIFHFTLLQISNATLISVTNLNLFFSFLKIGAILYGSGYVLFAFLDAELVAKGIISRQLLIDAIAAGQITPGPVFSAVTFIGYQVNGISGAVISTLAIFLPSFVFVALLKPLVKQMRNSILFSAFLDAVNVASVAVIIAVCFNMGQESITDWRTILIGAVSLILAFGFKKINTAFIVAGGSLLGYLLLFL